MSKIFSIFITIFIAIGMSISSSPAEAAYVPSSATVAAYEARIAWKINKTRYAYRRGYVRPSACPDYYAEYWSARIARYNLWYHQSMYTILKGCHARIASEVIGKGNVSADAMVTAWMNSPTHRAVILDGRLKQIGVGAVYRRGMWYVVADFTLV